MTKRRICNHLSVFLVAIVWVAVNLSVAQDRAVIQQVGGSRIPLTGVVEDFTGRDLRFRSRTGDGVKRYSRSEVVDVITQYTAHHDEGRKLLAAGKVAEAKIELTTALNDEDRPWVRREILAGLVRCALWNGDYQTAVTQFGLIVDSDPETFHYNLIPLNWTDDEPPVKLEVEARQWIKESATPHSRLIGASWLLTTSDHFDEAEMTLKKLAREPDLRIQRLAQMQYWRVKRKSKDGVDEQEVHRWQTFVDDLPAELRPGGHFLIAATWKDRREFERAARAYLWLPLVYDADRWLCAQSAFEAAESLRAMGDLTQAANTYSEVVLRYGDTRWGRPADAAWKAIRQSAADANDQTTSGTDKQ